MHTDPFPYATPEEALESFRARDRSGFSQTMNAQATLWWKGEAELVIPLKPELLQHHGYAHGAIVGAAADNACAWAAASAVGDVVTSSYTIQFLAPAKGDQLRARGIVLKAGKRQVSCEAKVWCRDAGEERLVAVALAMITQVARG